MKIKVVFIYVLFLSFSSLYTEYLIFKKDKNLSILPITEKEHEFVYDILLKYQWPMCIANPDKKDLAKYTLAEAGPLEEKFIRLKIQEKFKDLDIVFIPNLVYELFCLTKLKQLESFENFIHKLPELAIMPYLEKENSSIKGVLEKLNLINNSKETIRAHFSINNLFLNFILNKFNSTQYFFYKSVLLNSSNIAGIIQKNIENILTNDFLSQVRIKTTNLFKNSIYLKIINIEYDMHNKNYGLIYRSTNESEKVYIPGKGLVESLDLVGLHEKNFELNNEELFTFKKFMDMKNISNISNRDFTSFKIYQKKIAWLFSKPSRSISYGNSFFSGIINDEDASVSYHFESKPWRHLYVLKINKFAYLKETLPINDVRILFRITPLSSLSSLFSHGEFFHPRTKSFYFKDSSTEKISGFEHKDLIDKAGYLLIPGNTIEMNAKLSDYIAKNAIVFRPADKTEADKLIQGQKDVTALFKAMDVIYKYAKRDEKILK